MQSIIFQDDGSLKDDAESGNANVVSGLIVQLDVAYHAN